MPVINSCKWCNDGGCRPGEDYCTEACRVEAADKANVRLRSLMKDEPQQRLRPVCGDKIRRDRTTCGDPYCERNRPLSTDDGATCDPDTSLIQAILKKADKKSKQPQEPPMSEAITKKKSPISEAWAKSATDAQWQTAANAAAEAMRAPVTAFLMTHSTDKSTSHAIAAFMATPAGSAVLQAILGTAPMFFPQVVADPRAARLAEEMRTSSARFVTDHVAKVLVGPMIAAMTEAVSKCPTEGK